MSGSYIVQKTARSNESVAAMQAKAKALKEQQRSRLDSRHYYMIEIVADRLQLDTEIVEEFLLDGDQVYYYFFIPKKVILTTMLFCHAVNFI